MGYAGILIERQSAGLYVNQVPGLLRRGLLAWGLLAWRNAGGDGFQVDPNFALRSHGLGCGVVSKFRAVNLVRAVLLAAINNDADVMQCSFSALFVLLNAGCVDGEQRLAGL